MWAIDLQHDETSEGKALRLLHLIDEKSREALDIVVRSISADDTVEVLERAVARRGRAPTFLRMDDGPELTANALRDWCRFSGSEPATSSRALLGRTVRRIDLRSYP